MIPCFKSTNLFLIIIIYCTSKSAGSYYDIITKYSFNTKSTVEGNTEYLDTCDITVHIGSNAIGLPYLNMNQDEPYKVIYPVPKSAIPPLTLTNVDAGFWKVKKESLDNLGIDNVDDVTFMFRTRKGDLARYLPKETKAKGTCSHLSNKLNTMAKHNEERKYKVFDRLKWPGQFLGLKVKKPWETQFSFKLKETTGKRGIEIEVKPVKTKVIFSGTEINFDTNATYALVLYMSIRNDKITVYDGIGQNEHYISNQDKQGYDYGTQLSDDTQSHFELACDEAIVDDNRIEFEIVDFFDYALQPDSPIKTSRTVVRNDTSLFILYHTKLPTEKVVHVLATGQEDDPTMNPIVHQIIPNDINDSKYVLVKVTTSDLENGNQEVKLSLTSPSEVYIRWIWEGGPSVQTVHRFKKRTPCLKKSDMVDIYDVALKDPEFKEKEVNCMHGGRAVSQKGYCVCMPGNELAFIKLPHTYTTHTHTHTHKMRNIGISSSSS
ncbi:hypothetical protein WDU94_010744 [Cyamophila willieti]